MGSLHQIKGDINVFLSKLSLHGFASNFHSYLVLYCCVFCVNIKQIHAGKALKKIHLNLLFDVGGPCSLLMAGTQSNFELWPVFCTIYLIPALNLRPGLNSVAFFTYVVKFPAFKLVSFMAYTYNIQGWQDGTRHWDL